MITIRKNNLRLLRFSNLSGFTELFHFVTTREGGISTGHYSTFNLGTNSGDNPDNVLQNRNILCNAINMDPNQLIFPKQIHSGTVKIITREFLKADEYEKKVFLLETDAVVTNIQGVCLAIKTADCLPILLFDPKNKVIGTVHAGWRGTLKGIVLKAVKLMISDFNSDPSEIIASIGPSISPSVYEVGQEVWSRFDKKYLLPDLGRPDNKCFLDLWKANHDQLTQAEIPEKQIELAGLCTYSNPETFFSARRDGLNSGRIASGIMML